jgi:Spy/CpxP family protein refolding chaperone
MQYHRIARLAAAGALLVVAAPLVAYAQNVTGTSQAQVHVRRSPENRMFAALNLTDDQKAQMNTIQEKYRDKLSSARAAAKPDFDAARAAKARGDTAAARAAMAKAREAMKAGDSIRQQEMAEMRGVLTDAQREQLDAHKAQQKAPHGTRKPGA